MRQTQHFCFEVKHPYCQTTNTDAFNMHIMLYLLPPTLQRLRPKAPLGLLYLGPRAGLDHTLEMNNGLLVIKSISDKLARANY